MNILIDIGHPAHVNFFKNALHALKKNNNIIIIYLDRGKLPLIVKNELNEFECYNAGKHRGNLFSIIFQANISKFFSLLLIIIKKRAGFGLSVGSFTLGSALKILGKKNIQFDDDPERKINVFLEILTSNELYFPPITKKSKYYKNYNALKEWAYLSPKYFKPNIKVLEKYKLKPKEYFFIREVSTGSLNYHGQKKNLIAKFAHSLPKNIKIILSLEDKTTMNQYPDDWIILKEPVNDIHSLMYYSRLNISSGDSMAREGGMLGVPSIYCGFRKMKANDILISKNIMLHLNPEVVVDTVHKFDVKELKFPEQNEFRNQLLNEWDDVTQLIVKTVNKYVGD